MAIYTILTHKITNNREDPRAQEITRDNVAHMMRDTQTDKQKETKTNGAQKIISNY